jgi:ankyrin repeat protein
MNDLLEFVLARDLPALQQALFERHSDPNVTDDFGSPLAMAASCNFVEGIELLLRAGADIDRSNTDDLEYRPLEVAARGGHLDAVRCLIEHGANINGRNSILGTPLIGATVAAEPEVVAYLVAKGADIDAVDNEGQTALNYLCGYAKRWASAFTVTEWIDGKEVTVTMGQFEKHAQIFTMLLEHGTDVNHMTSYGYSALHLVVESKTNEWIEPLLHAGAHVNGQHEHGLSPLHAACAADNVEGAQMLLKRGADRALVDSDGRTPLMIAQASNSPGLIALFSP